MAEVLKFVAEHKEKSGKSSAKAVRRQGNIPAVIYSGGEQGQMVALSLKEFSKQYLKGGIKTKLVEITVGGKPITVVTKDIQIHPVTDNPIHIDFLKVNKDTLIKVAVAIKVLNEDKAPGIKKGGIVNVVHRTVDFYCHPSEIPHYIEVDVGNLEIGQNVHINDIQLPEGVKPALLTNFTVVSIMARVEEKEATATTPDAAAPEPAGSSGAPAA